MRLLPAAALLLAACGTAEPSALELCTGQLRTDLGLASSASLEVEQDGDALLGTYRWGKGSAGVGDPPDGSGRWRCEVQDGAVTRLTAYRDAP